MVGISNTMGQGGGSADASVCLLEHQKSKTTIMLVAQSCPTPRNPMDCSPPGSFVRGIFQARILPLNFPLNKEIPFLLLSTIIS